MHDFASEARLIVIGKEFGRWWWEAGAVAEVGLSNGETDRRARRRGGKVGGDGGGNWTGVHLLFGGWRGRRGCDGAWAISKNVCSTSRSGTHSEKELEKRRGESEEKRE